jgi:hypothetical protein
MSSTTTTTSSSCSGGGSGGSAAAETKETKAVTAAAAVTAVTVAFDGFDARTARMYSEEELEDMNNAKLTDICRQRQISTIGTKKELRERILEHNRVIEYIRRTEAKFEAIQHQYGDVMNNPEYEQRAKGQFGMVPGDQPVIISCNKQLFSVTTISSLYDHINHNAHTAVPPTAATAATTTTDTSSSSSSSTPATPATATATVDSFEPSTTNKCWLSYMDTIWLGANYRNGAQVINRAT